MKFKVDKSDISKTVQKVQNAIASKSTLPILSNILLETQKNNLKITATDLDIGISSNTEVTSEIDGAITLPAKKFLDIIKELPDENTVLLTVKKNNVATIECGKVMFKLVGLPKNEFPQPPQFKNKEKIKLPQNALKDMISMTLFAVSRDETRYILNGVQFVIRQNSIKLIATDGRRLAVIEKELQEKASSEKRAIIPTKTIQELYRLLEEEGDLGVIFEENQVLFELSNTVIVSRLIEGEFPNCEQVIPGETKEKILVDRDMLLAATKRASILTNQDSLAVKLDVSKNRMAVSKNTPYMGEVREELDITYGGKDVSIGFNPYYIIEVLKNINTKQVGLEIIDSDKPGVIRLGNEYVYVVLPMQIT